MAEEKLIVASDGEERHMILQFEGDILTLLVDEFRYSPEEMELEPPNYGFWIWEGTLRVTPASVEEGDYNVFPLGSWRVPTSKEWEAISDLELVDDDAADD